MLNYYQIGKSYSHPENCKKKIVMDVDATSPPSPAPPPLPPDPPDPDPTTSEIRESRSVKRRMGEDSEESGGTGGKVKAVASDKDTAPSVASVQTTWMHATLVIGVKEYSTSDKGPFIIHVSREVPDPSAGTSIRPIKFGQFLCNYRVGNICADGIKSVGRNRVSVEFRSAADANKFLDNSTLLSQYKYIASIPTFNITRMGLVKNVPIDMSMEEFAENLDVPNGCGYVIKARRLNRKSIENGNITWIPTQSVVLTFRGQVLPNRVFSYHTSLPVQIYQLPTIQCQNCCRFGHIKTQCRSKPRCFKCGKEHTGESCDTVEAQAYCLHCTGTHFASSKICPELERQKSVKAFMSQNGISYEEAATHFPKVGRSYTEVAQEMLASSSLSSQQASPSSPNSSNSRSYVKTVYATARPRAPLTKSYDKASHQEITSTPSSSLPNGHAFMSQSQSSNDNRQSFLIETLLNLLIELCSSSNLSLPSNVAQKLSQIFTLTDHNGSSVHSPVELKKSPQTKA